MKNKSLILVGVLLITVLILAACGESSSGDSSQVIEATPGGNDGNTTASGADFELDPANASGDNAEAAAGYLYEGLVLLQDGNIAYALAGSITVSEDGLDYIFNLRPGVTFHDGSALTADTVIANFNRWFDPNDANRGSGSYAAWVENFGGFKGDLMEDGKPKSHFDGIEKVDDLTVLLHLNSPDPDLLIKLAKPAFSIISPNAFAGGDGGTGPYKFSASSDSNITLEPFTGYWDPTAIPSQGMEIPAP